MFTFLSASVVLAALAAATSPYVRVPRTGSLLAPGLPFTSPDAALNLEYIQSPGQNLTPQPGQVLLMSETLDQPTLSINNPEANGPYILIMVDSSIDMKDPTIDLLHWLQPDLFLDNSTGTLQNQTAPLANYLSPQPISCPLQPSHDYTLMLFDQPSNFSIPQKYQKFMVPVPSGSEILSSMNPGSTSGTSNGSSSSSSSSAAKSEAARYNFPITNFTADVGLDQPVAANWFKVALDPEAVPAATQQCSNATTNGTISMTPGTTPTSKPSRINSSMANSPSTSTATATPSTGVPVGGAPATEIAGRAIAIGGLALGLLF